MKNYFQLTLTGKKLFPVWFAFLVLFIAPYFFIAIELDELKKFKGDETQQFYALVLYYLYLIPVVTVFFLFVFYAFRLIVNNTEYKDNFLCFDAGVIDFLKIFVGNFCLIILSFGLYTPWFLSKLYAFFAHHTRLKDDRFEFKGKGLDLLLIYIFWILIPLAVLVFLIIFTILVVKMIGADDTAIAFGITSLVVPVINILMVPFNYYSFKWIFNFQYRGYNIHWETHLINSMAMILGQVLLTLITFGLYAPLASLRVYRYFLNRTVAYSDTHVKHFGYDLNPISDFLFILVQLVLTFVTLGIYFPWAVSEIGELVIGKTFLIDGEMHDSESFKSNFLN